MRAASGYCTTALRVLVTMSAICPAFFAAHADDCPGAVAPSSSFVVERGDGTKVSVFHLADGIVRTIYQVRGATVLETTELQGLFPVERIDRGRRETYQAKTDLKKLLPLRVGQKITANFDVEASGQAYAATFALVVKKTDTLYIAACKYAVFQIEKNVGRGERAPVFINNDYYAANLKLIVAKEYKERDGTSTWIKYDKIYFAERSN
jgi:hypothetical protein